MLKAEALGHYTVDPESECWLWLGGTSHGRPMVRLENPIAVAVYRLFYEHHRGDIPEAHDLHHTCETPLCVNPEHLTPLSKVDHGRLSAGQRNWRWYTR